MVRHKKKHSVGSVSSGNSVNSRNRPFNHSKSVKPINWLVDGMIPRDALSMIISQEGVGKSFFVESLSECVIHGSKFMGRDTNPSDVLLIDQDTPTNTLETRLKAFHKGIREEQICDLYTKSFEGCSLSDNSLLSAINRSDAEVVIIDSLHSVSGKLNTNSVKDMQALSKLKQRVLESGKTLIITHHISSHAKINAESIMSTDRVGVHSMGSSIILQQADAYFMLGSKTNSDLTNLYVRPVQKRISLDVKPFVARLIEHKSKGKMKFYFLKDYIKKPLNVEFEVDRDILECLQSRKGESLGVNQLYYELNQKHSMYSIRNSVLRLAHDGRAVEIRHSPHKFTYKIKLGEKKP